MSTWWRALASSALVLAAGAAHADAACPAGVPSDAHCYNGRDSAGAPYWIAIPGQWDHVLVMHAHGGPPFNNASIDYRGSNDDTQWLVQTFSDAIRLAIRPHSSATYPRP